MNLLGDLITKSTKGFDAYQDKARIYAVYPFENSIVYPILGLAGEAGEVAGKMSKIMRDKDGLVSTQDREDLGKELGDVLWFVAQAASDLGLSLGDIADGNLDKLADRAERGVLKGSGDDR